MIKENFKEVGCRFRNKKTKEIKDLWLNKKDFEGLSFGFLKNWEQISYNLKDFGGLNIQLIKLNGGKK